MNHYTEDDYKRENLFHSHMSLIHEMTESQLPAAPFFVSLLSSLTVEVDVKKQWSSLKAIIESVNTEPERELLTLLKYRTAPARKLSQKELIALLQAVKEQKPLSISSLVTQYQSNGHSLSDDLPTDFLKKYQQYDQPLEPALIQKLNVHFLKPHKLLIESLFSKSDPSCAPF